MVLGIDEASSNVIRHAYNSATTERIILSCEHVGGSIRFTLRDFGNPADPAALEGRPQDTLEPGGLGLHFIRRVFDSVDYRARKPGTELVLLKRLPAGQK